jgi:hypothetical protein
LFWADVEACYLAMPLCIELYAGLHGWGEGFATEGYRCVGFDIVDMCALLGHRRSASCQLVLQDVLTLHGSQFKDAAVIVASPPCQEYSYRAMPWSRARSLPPPDNSLFEACFRIQREACEAAGRFIPLIVENVRGAQKWVGKAKWHFGSYYLWGDVPALMPIAQSRKIAGQNWKDFRRTGEISPHWRMKAFQSLPNDGGYKCAQLIKFDDGASHTRHLTNPAEHVRIEYAGVKLASPGHYRKSGSGPDWFDGGGAASGSNSLKRKAASAMLAKIPFPLAQHIARVFHPSSFGVDLDLGFAFGARPPEIRRITDDSGRDGGTPAYPQAGDSGALPSGAGGWS